MIICGCVYTKHARIYTYIVGHTLNYDLGKIRPSFDLQELKCCISRYVSVLSVNFSIITHSTARLSVFCFPFLVFQQIFYLFFLHCVRCISIHVILLV